MKMSCNGCRVLRKGCTDECIIRPCLSSWLKNPESQANATVFLAKFYGRAGLINLVAAGPENLRPAIFRSLVYEACGRILNPIYGSVGLLCSGNWYLCQAAVEAVLKGEDLTTTIPTDGQAAAAPALIPMNSSSSSDIRHVNKAAAKLHKIAAAKGRKSPRFMRQVGAKVVAAQLMGQYVAMANNFQTHDHSSAAESLFSHVSQAEPEGGVPEVELELTLGLEPAYKGKAPVDG